MLGPSGLLEQLKPSHSSFVTSADRDRLTLFLDGIDELDLACQKVLLTLLPDGQMDEVAGSRMRLIASASPQLDLEVQAGRFKRELYYRISAVCLRLPALRERKEDIGELVEHFFKKHAANLQANIPSLGEEEMHMLQAYSWPGNIRELENLARNILILGDAKSTIEELCPPTHTTNTARNDEPSSSLKKAARAASRQAERELILKALERTHWNRKRAAQELQISYKSLLYKIKEAGVEEKSVER